MARNRYDEDEALEENFDLKQVLRLLHYVKPYKKKVALTFFVMLSSALMTTFIPKLFQLEMDVFIPAGNIAGIAGLAAATAVICLYIVLSIRWRINLTVSLGQDMIYHLREDLFYHLQELPFSYYDERPHGKIQVRVVNYVNNLSDVLSNGILQTITDCFNLVFIMVFMAGMSLDLAVVCFMGIPVLLVVVFFIKKFQRKAWQLQSNKQSNLNAYIAESINGIRVTQAFVREEENIKIFDGLSMSYRKAWMLASYYGFAMGPTVDLISTVTTAFVYVLGVNYIVHGGTNGVSVGVLAAFTAYISRFWQPINTIANFYNSVVTAVSYLERIFETIDEPVEVKDAEDAVEMPKIKGNVTFSHVDFSYEDGVQVLRDVSFQVKAGQRIAFVGPTGAGKSTIVNLISRFYNVDGGVITIDGQDISKVTLHSLRSQMGVMMQDSFIFGGTIMDNIRYGNKTASDEDVLRAAKTVCAHDFIMQMEKGYETEVNERGSRLSQGQRQLISFARALLANPEILILDEATSSIDTETEILVQKGLEELLKGRTSFIIAHRLSTIIDADQIMYIDDGGIVEAGTHDELMKQKGKYYDLVKAQGIGFFA